MTQTKQRTVYRKKRKRTFGGVKKQDLPMQNTESNDTDTTAGSSPAKKNRSFEKINRKLSSSREWNVKSAYKKNENSTWIRNEFTKQYCAMP